MLFRVIQVIKVLAYPIIFNISQILIMLLFVLLNPEINMNDSNALSQYINKNTLLILLIQCVIFIPIFYSRYKKNNIDKNDVSYIQVIKIIIFSVLLSVSLNFVILFIKNLFDIKVTNSLITFTTVLGTGILGPIVEELLFRGIIFERFKNLFKEKNAILLSVFVFAIFHTGGIFQIVFAFIIGYYLTYVYKTHQNIYLSMIAHIGVNISSLLISPLLLMLF